MIDAIFSTSDVETTLSISTALLTLLVAILLGAAIGLTYMKTQPTYSQSFTFTMIVLPAIVAIIILLIGSNIARAFSLAGAFSIIRFRSAPGDSKDISYVLFAMAAGLSAGVGAFGYAVLFTVILCVLMYVLNYFNIGAKKAASKLLKITIPENLGYEEAFEAIFNRHLVKYELQKVKTAELGSLYVVTYAVDLSPDTNQKAFLDDIRTRNGNLDITLTMNPAAQS